MLFWIQLGLKADAQIICVVIQQKQYVCQADARYCADDWRLKPFSMNCDTCKVLSTMPSRFHPSSFILTMEKYDWVMCLGDTLNLNTKSYKSLLIFLGKPKHRTLIPSSILYVMLSESKNGHMSWIYMQNCVCLCVWLAISCNLGHFGEASMWLAGEGVRKSKYSCCMSECKTAKIIHRCARIYACHMHVHTLQRLAFAHMFRPYISIYYF